MVGVPNWVPLIVGLVGTMMVNPYILQAGSMYVRVLMRSQEVVQRVGWRGSLVSEVFNCYQPQSSHPPRVGGLCRSVLPHGAAGRHRVQVVGFPRNFLQHGIFLIVQAT